MDEPMYRGEISPGYRGVRNINSKLVESKIIVPTYKRPGKHEYLPSFLLSPTATKNVSPATYKADESYKKTQSPKTLHYSGQAPKRTVYDIIQM